MKMLRREARGAVLVLMGTRRVGVGLVSVVVSLLAVWGAALAGAMTMTAPAVAGALSPVQGVFSGVTSQSGNGNVIRFRLSGSSVRDEFVSWRARCRSGRTLLDGTVQPELGVIGGAWRDDGGTYVARLLGDAYPVSGPVVGHFRVLTNTGRFESVISATGVERVTATLYKSRRRIDFCATGSVNWTAGNTSARGGSSPLIVPANATIGGLDYAQWETKSSQWSMAHLHSHDSRPPRMSVCVTTGQHGPVWFPGHDSYDLGLNALGTVTCHIPVGQYVLLGPSYECSNVEQPPFYASTDAGLIRCAHVASAESLSFDGQLLSPSGFPLSTGVFRFTMPARHNLLGVPGKTHGRSAVYARPIILGPLSAGVHTIIQTRHYRGPAFVGTLRLIVS